MAGSRIGISHVANSSTSREILLYFVADETSIRDATAELTNAGDHSMVVHQVYVVVVTHELT